MTRALILWLAQRGGQLHEQLVVADRAQVGSICPAGARRQNMPNWTTFAPSAPNAIPGPLMRTLWRLLLSGASEIAVART